MNEETFYAAVGRLLGIEHTYIPFPHLRPDGSKKRTRWNNRHAGNGRFPGVGLVRMFSPNLVHVALYSPRFHARFDCPHAALDAIALRLTWDHSGPIRLLDDIRGGER